MNLPSNPIFEVADITEFNTLEILNLENTSITDLKILGQVNWIITLNIAGTKVKRLKGIELGEKAPLESFIDIQLNNKIQYTRSLL